MKKGFIKIITKDTFIKKAIIIHENKYNYTLLSNSFPIKDKVSIICNKHGVFNQNFDVHCHKKCGCPKCTYEKVSSWTKKPLSFYLQKLKNKFGNNLSYEIINEEKSLIKIICEKHGSFIKDIRLILINNNSCVECGKEKCGYSHDFETILFKFKEVHGNRYDYSLVKYKNRRTLVDIICKEHGIFKTTPEIHLKGCNCPACNITGWDKTSWTKLCETTKSFPLIYIIRCFNDSENFIKIGRTKRKIHDRFLRPSIMPYNYEVIKTIEGTADFVYDEEIRLHREFYKYKYKPKLQFPGSTECFDIKILNLFI